MASGHLPPTHSTCLPAPLTVPATGSPPQSLWDQLDPMSRHQLAEFLAQLIWRIRRQPASPEGDGHE